MTSQLPKLLAALVPGVYCQSADRKKVQRAVRDSWRIGNRLAYQHAAALAEPVSANKVALPELMEANPFKLPGHRSPIEQHTLELENVAEPLEPFYFQLLEHLQQQEGWQITKLVDTVTSTNGPGFSTDLTRRVLQQQQQATEQMGRIQQQNRALLRQWQEWKERRAQLQAYEVMRGPPGKVQEAAQQALHLRWRRLIETSPHDHIPNTDAEFRRWLKSSEVELRRQIEVERRLLAHQLSFLKLQAGWLKPYLQPAVASGNQKDPALLNAFNTALFEVVLLVELPSQLESRVKRGELPKMLLARKHRRAAPMMMIELRFRAIPERTKAGHYGYRGRVTATFTSFALHAEELTILVREIQRNEWGEVFGLLEKNHAGDLHRLLNDLDELLVEPHANAETEANEPVETNPFTALFDFSGWRPARTTPPDQPADEPLAPDTETEAVLRTVALLEARELCLELYHRCKELFTVAPHRV